MKADFSTKTANQDTLIETLTAFSMANPLVTIPSVTALTAAGWVVANYRVGKPNEYVVRTGPFINDVDVSRKALRLPFQEELLVDVNPVTYDFDLHNMSKGKVEFNLPIVMTIGPMLPEEDSSAFQRYCKLLQDMTPESIRETVKGIVEGETRVLTAQLTVEEMFNGREVFRERVSEKIAPDLESLGLKIYNANIREMEDFDENNKYFEYRKQRAIEMANNEARSDVAHAQKQGDVAVSLNERDTRVVVADNNRHATQEEYIARRAILEAEADVAIQEAATQRARELSMMEAEQAVELRREELQREIEERRYEQKIQNNRASIVASALADAEAQERLADANLYAKQKEAEGTLKVMQAKADGMTELFEACASDKSLAKFYLGMDSGMWPELAKYNAEAVKDMNPDITIWNTGNNPDDASLPIVKMVQSFTPLLKEVQKQFVDSPTKSNN